MINKYVILHSEGDKDSRAFVAANPTYQVIDVYKDKDLAAAYFSKDYPHPSVFPSVVDTENKIICHKPADMMAALTEIAKYPEKVRQSKFGAFKKSIELMMKEIEKMALELTLGLRKDQSEIKAYYEEILALIASVTDTTTEIEKPKTAIDSLDIYAKVKELRAKAPKGGK